jgi:hypothetical protein
MPRGSKPGERRGGRQRGTPNKKTALRNAAIGAAVDPNISPRDFMLGLMRNGDLPLSDRFAAAQAVLPLVHQKLTSGHATERSPEACGNDVADHNGKGHANSDPRVSLTTETGDHVVIRTKGADLSPLDFFLEVMRDPEAPVHLRTKAARIATPFVHPKPASRKPALVIEDPYGFDIDPVAARELRDFYKGTYWPLVINLNKYLPDKPFSDALVRFKRMEANLGASIRCPEGYTSVDEHEDLVRRDELFRKWRGRPPPLTGEEDAEEAHLFARIAAFKQETCRAGRRMDVLRNLGEKRSAAEQNELDALEARYRRIPPENGSFWVVDY